ncbi:response regulator [Anianabacter salinae]|uniref:response regulator n=1 Tax=Anianabacter salinae TaxID=2851023 RepID=UPI00225E6273|nr:response regulator [Anianabacter salinae]MBV0912636.1 response regulator [Anianabacter salinae]
MPDSNPLDLAPCTRPTADRPLAGITVLVVEDSRYASEAVRLLCLRSGARLRRADSLAAADRHLKVYRPTVILVDVGLPDGSGLDLIERLNRSEPRIPAIIAMSGEDTALSTALMAGANAALAKPLGDLGAFQETLLGALPPDYRPNGPRKISHETVAPDVMALHDDYARVVEMIGGQDLDHSIDYVAQFLTGLGRAAQDTDLETAATTLRRRHERGAPMLGDMARVAGLLQDRLSRRAAV